MGYAGKWPHLYSIYITYVMCVVLCDSMNCSFSHKSILYSSAIKLLKALFVIFARMNYRMPAYWALTTTSPFRSEILSICIEGVASSNVYAKAYAPRNETELHLKSIRANRRRRGCHATRKPFNITCNCVISLTKWWSLFHVTVGLFQFRCCSPPFLLFIFGFQTGIGLSRFQVSKFIPAEGVLDYSQSIEST